MHRYVFNTFLTTQYCVIRRQSGLTLFINILQLKEFQKWSINYDVIKMLEVIIIVFNLLETGDEKFHAFIHDPHTTISNEETFLQDFLVVLY